MAKNSKVVRIPKPVIEELDFIKDQFKIEKTGDALNKMADLSKRGRLKKVTFEFEKLKW